MSVKFNVIKSKAQQKVNTKPVTKDTTQSSPIGRRVVKPVVIGIKQKIDNSTYLIVNDRSEQKNLDISTYERIIEIDKKYPDYIVGFEPKLLERYIKKGSIINDLKVGDKVKRTLKYKVDNEPEEVITKIYFKGLGNMTVIIAQLTNNKREPIDRLEKC